MRVAGLVVVCVLACLALVLIILKFKETPPGPGVSAVPLTGPESRRPSNDPAAPPAAAGGGAKAPARGQAVDRDLEIQVIDAASKQPLAGAELSINMQGGGGGNRKDRTEQQGRAWLMLPPEDPKYLSISAKLEGYVTKRMDWRGEAIPATYVLALEKGTTIGGVVRDESGNPIRGADVGLLFPGDPSGGRSSMYMTEGPFKTDEEGKWRCDVVPADLTNLSLRLSHPNFISDESFGTTPRPADAELRALTAVSVMKRGIVLSGVVLDQGGKPIPGASVAQGADRFGSNNPKIKTDPDGKFAFPNARPGPIVLTVTAKTFAPELKQVSVAKDIPPVEIRLAPGNIVKGKIVDTAGKPVRGAFVAADTWRGNRSLEWRVDTKADGTFLWKEAPADEVLIDMGKQGFQSLRHFKVTPSETEYVITLQPPQKIHGMVVDAEGGAPISSFRVIQGLAWATPGANAAQPQQISWQRDYSSVSGRDGKFEMESTEPYPFRYVRIEAPGYLPAISPGYKPEETDVTFDVKLTKGTGPAGIVKLPDGSAAAGVDVVLTTASTGASMRNGVLDGRMNGNSPMVKTSDEGKFEFVPQVEAFLIVAAGPAGYAEVTQEQFKKSTEIKLLPWGRVEGKLLMGSKPGANQNVTMSLNRPYEEKAPRFWIQYDTNTDKDGNFVFERAPAGDAQVSRQVMSRTTARYTTSISTHTALVTIKGGETAKVQLGGVGRPVIGKITLPKEAAGQGWTLGGGISTKQAEPPLPKGFEDLPEDQQREWWKKYTETPEYKAQMKNTRHYSFQVADDGTFRVDDVVPGKYQLYLNASDTKGQFGEAVAMGSGELTMPEIPGGRSDDPLDAGSFEMKAIKRILVGDMMPELDLVDLDAKPLKLDAFRGKHLLLHVWVASSTDIPTVKELYEAYGKDRLAIVGVSFDRKVEVAKSFVAKNEIKWPQAFAGQKTNLYQVLSLRSFPSYMLIGPDGKVIARDIQLTELKATVAKALGK
jgi:peroxiredoxin